ncbi:TIGR04551 family protein [Chondromyces apiculatus]|uniref:TIGR04551 family protein n=1 Tax=Chondromyces apiculatus DSM 436 TaxID=1192034 RepID=A0A017TCK8_9BACT|nr:TIGR04551 family protein [Chondromyces apiculatus]EYF07013.1 hypothetical protein CAP_1272 [Chondromyces apiculatus DSM 436]
MPSQPAAPRGQPVATPAAVATAPVATTRKAGSPDIGARPSDVYAEDWWSHARPTFEVHGLFRVRAELFHQFALGRREAPGSALLWEQPPDTSYVDVNGIPHAVRLCGDDPLVANQEPCENNTHSGANMRFRLNPELHISDNVRVLSQIDLLDNIVLGSTPEGYANRPAGAGYQVVARGGYSPAGAFANTQWAPVSGVNSLSDSVMVKRVWGEYLTPVGLLRFGRMPQHWGLGMLWNSGDGHDSDWQTTVDRLMLVTGIKKYDIYFSAAWDFANEGAISASPYQQQGQAYDLSAEDDVDQFVFTAVRRKNPELQKLELARGNMVLNGGVHFTYRNQTIANDISTTPDAAAGASLGQTPAQLRDGWTRRGVEMFIPDLWFQFLYKKFRFEAEAAAVLGSMENTAVSGSDYENLLVQDDNGWGIRQFGITTQAELRAFEDRLRVQFNFGYASGDDDVAGFSSRQGGGIQPQLTADRTYSTFSFHPDYRVDLILWRNILQRVQGAYYFRPSVEYDFARDKNGQRLGGGAAAIWSRAAEFAQTPGHARDLGIELNATLYYQARDGALNDDPNQMGGFYTMMQYGVMFPLGGLGYLPGQVSNYGQITGSTDLDTSTAQTVRWYLGILF